MFYAHKLNIFLFNIVYCGVQQTVAALFCNENVASCQMGTLKRAAYSSVLLQGCSRCHTSQVEHCNFFLWVGANDST